MVPATPDAARTPSLTRPVRITWTRSRCSWPKSADEGAEDGAGPGCTSTRPGPATTDDRGRRIRDRLVAATPTEAAAVELYEATKKSRSSVLEAAERALTSLGGSRAAIRLSSSIAPRLFSGSFRLPHFGDCTQDGQPLSHGHSEIRRSASPTSASKRS